MKWSINTLIYSVEVLVLIFSGIYLLPIDSNFKNQLLTEIFGSGIIAIIVGFVIWQYQQSYIKNSEIFRIRNKFKYIIYPELKYLIQRKKEGKLVGVRWVSGSPRTSILNKLYEKYGLEINLFLDHSQKKSLKDAWEEFVNLSYEGLLIGEELSSYVDSNLSDLVISKKINGAYFDQYHRYLKGKHLGYQDSIFEKLHPNMPSMNQETKDVLSTIYNSDFFQELSKKGKSISEKINTQERIISNLNNYRIESWQ